MSKNRKWKWASESPKSWSIRVSHDKKYEFGFTNWTTPGHWEDDIDEFEAWTREIRKAAGIEDPPPKKKWVTDHNQIRYSGTIHVTNPSYHGQIRNITTDEQESSGCPDGSDE